MPLLATFAMAITSNQFAAHLVALEPNAAFPPKGTSLVRVFPSIDAGIPFREMVASWNVESAEAASLKIEVKAHGEGFDTKWYTLAQWTLDPQLGPRGSVNGQKDELGTVDTDTLVLAKEAKSVDIQVTMNTLVEGHLPRLKLLTFSFLGKKQTPAESKSASPTWGKLIDVPQRAQGNYPNGGVLCSPTSMSMVLWHYSNLLGKPELNKDVPEVEAHVWDPIYKGAGNWPFNTAYAGSLPGMRSYVSRFSEIQDLETWIEAGFPVICSVSFDLLRGLPLSPKEQGHLVVLVGFEKKGDPIINDPAFKAQVRKTYKRSDFEAAWDYSKHTVYLVYPEASRIPKDVRGLWFTP